MKILQINKTDIGGGAAVAAKRLNSALLSNGYDSKLLVQDARSSEGGVYPVDSSVFSKQLSHFHKSKEHLSFIPYERNAIARKSFSCASQGIDISDHPLVKEADILHLHWINDGFLSLKTLGKLFALGKPVVWTQHDMWSFTGGCHFAGTCLEFLEFCSYCPFLRKSGKKDLSARLFAQKRKIYGDSNLSIVTCSKWLRTLSQESKLLRRKDFYNIPNPIDTDLYKPGNKEKARLNLGLPTNKKLILFGADDLNDPRKGFRYLIEALSILGENFPAILDSTELVSFGKINKQIVKHLPFKLHSFKYVVDPQKLVDIYNAADCYVLPSLQDNLPNTIMESMACGTPVVGFSIGGVPEMVTHNESGYLAEVKNSLSLATGIYHTLFVGDISQLENNARMSAVSQFAEKTVVDQYVEVYKSLLKRKTI